MLKHIQRQSFGGSDSVPTGALGHKKEEKRKGKGSTKTERGRAPVLVLLCYHLQLSARLMDYMAPSMGAMAPATALG